MSLYDVCHVVFLSMGHPCTNQIFVLNFLVLVVGPPCISVVSVSDILVRSLSQTSMFWSDLCLGLGCLGKFFVLDIHVFCGLCLRPPSVSGIPVRSLSQTFISKSVSIRDVNVLV